MEIIFDSLIFAVTLNLYYRIMQGKKTFNNKSEMVKNFIRPTLIFTLFMIPWTMLTQAAFNRVQPDDIIVLPIMLGTLRFFIVIMTFKFMLSKLRIDDSHTIDESNIEYDIAKYDIACLAYVLSVAGQLLSSVIVNEIEYSIIYPLILPLFVDSLVVIPISIVIYYSIAKVPAKVEVSDGVSVKLGVPMVVGFIALIAGAALRDLIAVNLGLSVGLAVVLVVGGFLFARHIKKKFATYSQIC